MPKRVIDYQNLESLFALGLNNKTVARAIGWSETAFSAHLHRDKKMQDAMDKGKARVATDIQIALMRKACGDSFWEEDKVKRMHGLGGKNSDTRALIYVDTKLHGQQVQKFEVSGPGGAPLVRSLAELMSLGETEGKPQESDTGQKMPKKAPKLPA